MGKVQSKRSVNITTDHKKTLEKEISAKVEKIEDIDHKEANLAEKEKQEKNCLKKEELNVNNDKATCAENDIDAYSDGDNAYQNKSEIAASSRENVSINGDDATVLAEDTIKKTKKEKVKKKWSFRNISFGRKDKQKPFTNEENSSIKPFNSNADQKHLINGKETKNRTEKHFIKIENHDDLKTSNEKFELNTKTEEKPTEQKNNEAPQTSTNIKKETFFEILSDIAQNETKTQGLKDATIEIFLKNSTGKLENCFNGFSDKVPEANCENIDKDLSNKTMPSKIISETMTSKESPTNGDTYY